MDRTSLEQYRASMQIVLEMKKQGIISDKDFQKSEAFLAKKYCIKKDNLYRLNELLFSSFRAIYMNAKKEVVDNGNNGNENRCITKIE